MEIGIIGLGGMGKLYARTFAAAGYKVNGSDTPQKRLELSDFCNQHGVRLMEDGAEVSRSSDVVIYSVPPFELREIVKKYGPHTKVGAIVSGQTSIKTPEIQAFDLHIPEYAEIVPVHSMHGPSIETSKGTMVIIPYRASQEGYERAKEVFGKLGSKMIEMKDYRKHDEFTAETQVNTHLPFISMGTAWRSRQVYPWQSDAYVSGIDNVKILMMLRVFGGQEQVYAGLALLNPYAERIVQQYADSTSALFHLMITGKETEFRARIHKAKEFVFKRDSPSIGLDGAILDEYALGNPHKKLPNSHLSLLAMVDAWSKMKTNPYQSMVCGTPPFKLRLGIAEHLFTNESLLEESVKAAMHDKSIWGDDLEFFAAVKEWSSTIREKDVDLYLKRFGEVRDFFKDRIPEGMRKSTDLITRLGL